jgi:hypothetical protein
MAHTIANALNSKPSNYFFPERKELNAIPGFDGTGPRGQGRGEEYSSHFELKIGPKP